MLNIHDALLLTVERMEMPPSEINNGYCSVFASLVVESLVGVSVLCADYDFGAPPRVGGHTWIEYEGKHHDAECIDGVESFLDLPIFRRAISSGGFLLRKLARNEECMIYELMQ